MKLTKYSVFSIFLAVLVASSILFFGQKGLGRIELLSLDLFFRLRGPLRSNPHIVIIEIADSDILKVGRWPWKRSWQAAMTRALTGLGAKSIYFDIIFSETSTEEDDALFEEAIKQSKNVYLPFAFPDTSFKKENALLPLKRFSAYLKGTGTTNIYPDIDGIIRKIPLVFWEKENLHAHIALKLAMDYADLKFKEIKPRYVLLANSKEEVKIPCLEKNKMLINWSGKWQETFKHYGFLEVLAGYKDFTENKKSKINADDFKKSICIVGVTALGSYDIKPTPLEPAYPGLGIMANSIGNILDRRFIYHPPYWLNVLILYLLALIPAFLISGERPLRETLFIFLLGGIYFSMNFFLFKNGVGLNISTPLLGLFVSYLSVETYHSVRISVERRAFFKMSVTDGLTGLYNIRYFKLLLDTEIRLAKPDPSKKFSIVMSDIDHFKHFNDTYGHQVGDLLLKELANVLKASLRSSDIVARYGGEEMIILLRGASLKDSLNVAEKIRKNIEKSEIKDQNNTYNLTVSLGVSVFKSGDTLETIIKRADDGLYKAKDTGRNRVCTVEEST